MKVSWDAIRSDMTPLRPRPGSQSPVEDYPKKSNKSRRTIFVCLAVVALVCIGLVTSRYSHQSRELVSQWLHNKPGELIEGQYLRVRPGKHWNGWSSINRLMVFGDSWSSTGFDPEGQLPCSDNPFGNPSWPGDTSTDGMNWVDYVTYTYNESQILTANFAVGGATVDDELVASGVPMRTQIRDHWVNFNKHRKFKWSSASSLFVIWIGINDVHSALEDLKYVVDDEMAEYADLAKLLYKTGARNFVFMTVPPIERAPIAALKPEIFEEVIRDWNERVADLVEDFALSHPKATAFLFDVHEAMNDVLDDPCLMEESCSLMNTNEYCWPYSFGDTEYDPRCPYHVDEYVWMNPLHITTTAHQMIARAFVNALSINIEEVAAEG